MNFLRFLMIIGVAIAIGSTSIAPNGVHGLPAHSELSDSGAIGESSESTEADAEPMNDETLKEIAEMLADPQNHIQVIKMKSPSDKLKTAQGETAEPLPPAVNEQLEMAMALGENMMVLIDSGEAEEGEKKTEPASTADKDSELVKAAAALTDDEITEIVKMIQFPPDRVEEIVEDQDAYDKTATHIEHRTAVEGHGIVEPRTGRSLDSAEEGELLLEDPSTGRLISQRQFQKAMRRMMRQIKRATRNMTSRNKRKTSAVKDTDGISNDEDTVENFLRRLYASAGKQKKQSGLMSLIG